MTTIESPYSDISDSGWRGFRGNLHTHTTRSDGERDAPSVIRDYAGRGYDFLMIADHDITTTRDQCADWTAEHGIVLIPGCEISALGPHILHVGAARHVEPLVDRQVVIDQIAGTGGRGFAIVNHPNSHASFDQCPIAMLRQWSGYFGIEIYNGVVTREAGSPYATNKWDMLLSEGRRIWGFANDDTHAAEGDVERGWNVVYAPHRTADAIVDALAAGRFYASTGVVIMRIETEGDVIRIDTENAQRINAITTHGAQFAAANSRSIEVRVPAHARYVRFECWGAGETFAWTQPFFVQDSV